ncbi:hypothetical protein HAX54_002739, partial [Datura stramonium]|nr:hypothetical protein [Datura stramonium]
KVKGASSATTHRENGAVTAAQRQLWSQEKLLRAKTQSGATRGAKYRPYGIIRGAAT